MPTQYYIITSNHTYQCNFKSFEDLQKKIIELAHKDRCYKIFVEDYENKQTIIFTIHIDKDINLCNIKNYKTKDWSKPIY